MMRGKHWGKHKENGVWIASTGQWRFMFLGHDSLYIAAWRFRLRLMKPSPSGDKE